MESKKVYLVMADRIEEENGTRWVRSTCLYGVYSTYKKAVEVCKELEETYKDTQFKYYFYHLIREVE